VATPQYETCGLAGNGGTAMAPAKCRPGSGGCLSVSVMSHTKRLAVSSRIRQIGIYQRRSWRGADPRQRRLPSTRRTTLRCTCNLASDGAGGPPLGVATVQDVRFDVRRRHHGALAPSGGVQVVRDDAGGSAGTSGGTAAGMSDRTRVPDFLAYSPDFQPDRVADWHAQGMSPEAGAALSTQSHGWCAKGIENGSTGPNAHPICATQVTVNLIAKGSTRRHLFAVPLLAKLIRLYSSAVHYSPDYAGELPPACQRARIEVDRARASPSTTQDWIRWPT
jgi:hypothetical protein